jgi:hypothetical protein
MDREPSATPKPPGPGLLIAIRHECGQDHYESPARVMTQDILTCGFCGCPIEVTDEHRARAREIAENARKDRSLPR